MQFYVHPLHPAPAPRPLQLTQALPPPAGRPPRATSSPPKPFHPQPDTHQIPTNERAKIPSVKYLDDPLSRAVYATDASNYRIPPARIAIPANSDELRDVVLQALDAGTPITMRGRGTSCAGNAIGPGLVVDASKCREIIELDPDARTATLEPGVVIGSLQRAGQPHGLRFGPDPSTWTRATIGGVIGNNACGPHAQAWGRAADNVVSLQVVDGFGRVFTARSGRDLVAQAQTGVTPAEAAATVPGPDPVPVASVTGASNPQNPTTPESPDCQTNPTIPATVPTPAQTRTAQHQPSVWDALDVVPGLRNLVESNLALIRTECGRFRRQVSGYSLEHLLPDNGCDLPKFLAGSEGTLVSILRAKVRLVPVPAAPVLVVLGYASMVEAARDVPLINGFAPLAVEGMDRRLVDTLRQKPGAGEIPELPDGQAWLLVEMGGDEALEATMTRARAVAAAAHTSAVGVYPPGTDATRLWRIRADGAGLGGRTPVAPDGSGGELAWPGWEDAAVPPEHLADYLRDFEALMREFDVDGMIYGHLGDGCIHVRLNLPLGAAAGDLRRSSGGEVAVLVPGEAAVSGPTSQATQPANNAQFFQTQTQSSPGSTQAPADRTSPQPALADSANQTQTQTQAQTQLRPHPTTFPNGTAKSRAFLERAADLVARYHGSLSGEHGDGRARSELLPRMFSPQMIALFAQVKALFDPRGLLNPGVLVDPEPLDGNLRLDAARDFPPAPGGFDFRPDHGLRSAVHRCTGVGKCLAMDQLDGAWMCPSYLATGQEKDATRGRARALQEVANGGLIRDFSDPALLAALDLCLACKACSSACPTGIDMAMYRSEAYYRAYSGRGSMSGSGVLSGRGSRRGKVAEVAVGGVGAKADFRASAASERESTGVTRRKRARRPRSHYLLGRLPGWLKLARAIPGGAALGNAMFGVEWIQRAVFGVFGLEKERSMARLSTYPFHRWAKDRGLVSAQIPRQDLADGADSSTSQSAAVPGPPPSYPPPPAGSTGSDRNATLVGAGEGGLDQGETATDRRQWVAVWADSFSEGIDSDGARALTELLERAGYRVIVPPEACCGLTYITTGQLDAARRRLERLCQILGPLAVNGIPIVGVEPSCTTVLRDDLVRLLPDDPRAAAVRGATLTLAELLVHPRFGVLRLEGGVVSGLAGRDCAVGDGVAVGDVGSWQLPDLRGVKVVAQPHCHHYSVLGWKADRAILQATGAEVVELSGCCGMAGNFGMEQGHFEISRRIAEHGLLPALRENPDAVYLADGFSCRTQASQLGERGGVHLARLLLG